MRKTAEKTPDILNARKKKNLATVLFFLSFLTILAVSLYANSLITFSMQTMEYNIEHRLIAESKRLANMASAVELDKYRAVPDMELPEYNTLRQRLLDFSIDADVLYAYYMRPQKNGMQYIADNDFNEETRVGLDTPPFDPHPTPWILQVLEKKQAVCSGLGNYTPDWEGLLSGYAPIFSDDGNVTAIAGVDIEDETIVQAKRLVSILTIVQIIAVASILVFGIIYLSYLYRQTETAQELREKADAANRTKSNFLASMSHEIRTPMNAITGMVELLLRGELSDEARGYAQDIKHAGNNLISIINDILDFSKIEAGKMEIISVKYLLASLINDSVNIIRTRIGEKQLRFFTNIDGNIPNSFTGDEARLRQILLNLLSNAVKYSEKGYVGLTITMLKRDEKQVWLNIAVSDTGKGIKPEDREKLFGDFVQVDIKKNQGIEGAGLGLAITRRLCTAMNGYITVESEYGKGSVFTAVIPQTVEQETSFAAVEKPEEKKVLVYEGRVIYAKSVCWTLENLNIRHTMVTNLNEFTEALFREEWYYVFSGYGLYEKIKPLLEQPCTAFCGGKKPPLALMVEWGNEAFIPNVRFMSLPVQSLSIANILNGNADSNVYYDNAGTRSAIRFTLPGTRMLVVDDIATNLKVAEGLLAPYSAVVDTCLSGSQAVEMAKHHAYDIIFMDHMMPEMDGIEAASLIRAWEKERAEKSSMSFIEDETQRDMRKQIPIIALTANAVIGMKEIFIDKGFNDFLAKPIDVSKLDEMLERWIPKEKREKGSRETEAGSRDTDSLIPAIPGVDTVKGIALTGGTLNAYREVLIIFRKDAEERIPLLQTTPEIGAFPAFVTQVHALKSASAFIGAVELSALAAKLEAAGKAGDMACIQENLSFFVKSLSEIAAGISAWEKTIKEHNSDKQSAAGDINYMQVMPFLHKLAEALKSQRGDVIDNILEQIARQPLDAEIKTAMDQIADEVLIAEYGKALGILDTLLKGVNGN
ncbi:MAG: response regulator [Treponema sp.]|jgi:signal transduction histidine kinase/CheY-like chemotaxis protein/HPt (histidine-containing phosphotransfer) domain-containing protein|nr:response regulator [Treponema sp.]